MGAIGLLRFWREGAMAAILALAACNGGGSKKYDLGPVTDGSLPAHWTIGPILNGKTRSVGMPLHPESCPDAIFCFTFPTGPGPDTPDGWSELDATGHVHYLTFNHGSLAGKSRISMRYAVEVDPGVLIVPRTEPKGPSIITIYFQRRGDKWTGAGQYETYRWWATFASQMPITPGEHEMVAPFDAKWTSVMVSDAISKPAEFQAALSDAESVGFVLGGGDGYGHGVWATGPARFILREFRVE